MKIGAIEFSEESHKVKRVYLTGFYDHHGQWMYRLVGITGNHQILWSNFLIQKPFQEKYPNHWLFGSGIKAPSFQEAWDMVNQVMPEGIELMPDSIQGW
jgi:hypothetical protein